MALFIELLHILNDSPRHTKAAEGMTLHKQQKRFYGIDSMSNFFYFTYHLFLDFLKIITMYMSFQFLYPLTHISFIGVLPMIIFLLLHISYNRFFPFALFHIVLYLHNDRDTQNYYLPDGIRLFQYWRIYANASLL